MIDIHICIVRFENESKIKQMRIKKLVLDKVADSPTCKKLLMDALDISQPTMSRYIADNDDNLTKMAALKVIGDYFNLSHEEIIESEKAAA